MTFALTYYESPELLEMHFPYWRQYPSEVNIVLVDDGSTKFPASEVLAGQEFRCSVKLYQIEKDIRSNGPGARNLAFHVAKDGWVFCTDIDHLVSHISMYRLLGLELKADYYYRPLRIGHYTRQEIPRHKETFILTKKLFWEIGGYDEDLIKYYYNGPWSLFRQQLKAVADEVNLLSIEVEYVPSIPQVVTRKFVNRNKLNISKKPVNPLRFAWHEVDFKHNIDARINQL